MVAMVSDQKNTGIWYKVIAHKLGTSAFVVRCLHFLCEISFQMSLRSFSSLNVAHFCIVYIEQNLFQSWGMLCANCQWHTHNCIHTAMNTHKLQLIFHTKPISVRNKPGYIRAAWGCLYVTAVGDDSVRIEIILLHFVLCMHLTRPN